MRNRAEGWHYAKLSGHENEYLIAKELKSNPDFANQLLLQIEKKGNKIIDISYGGLHETSVSSVLNDFTKSKTDLTLFLNDNSKINISLKKSISGQVFLISKERFISGYCKMFDCKITDEVINAINLFWSNSKDDSLQDIIKYYASDYSNYEIKKNRLTASTLKQYNENLYNILLSWIKENIYNITFFCFSTGLSNDIDSYSDYVWFKNLVDPNLSHLNHIYNIKKLAYKSSLFSNVINYGVKNGGTTIILPFGSVQWHQGKLQFRHDLNNINYIYLK